MLFDYYDYPVILACGSTDMRKSINGLSDLVLHHFSLDPRKPVIFAFSNRERNRVKLLVWEDNGFWVHAKRLENGRLAWPLTTDTEQTMRLCREDFENLLRAPGVKQKIRRREAWKHAGIC